MKKFVILILCLSIGRTFADSKSEDLLRIRENECLAAAGNQRCSEAQFQASLSEVERLCAEPPLKEHFQEFRSAAEELFRARPLRVVVLGFSCSSPELLMEIGAVRLESAGAALLNALDSGYEKVDRAGMSKAVEELQLQSSDLFDRSTTVKLGKFVGAQYDIQGTIGKVGTDLIVTVNCTELETRVIRKSAKATLKEIAELGDAIPNLAAQLSLRKKEEGQSVLSAYAVKWLNAANREFTAERFPAAADAIGRSRMFLGTGAAGGMAPLRLQYALTRSACSAVERNHEAACAELEKQLAILTEAFGDADPAAIHSLYLLAENSLAAGRPEKAREALRDAVRLFRRTAPPDAPLPPGLLRLEKTIAGALSKPVPAFEKQLFEKEANDRFLQCCGLAGQPERRSEIPKLVAWNPIALPVLAVSPDAPSPVEKPVSPPAPAPALSPAASVVPRGSVSPAPAAAAPAAPTDPMKLAGEFDRSGRYAEALRQYLIAAECGNPKAYLGAALIHLSRQKGFYNERRGIEYLKKAAEGGVGSAQYNLGCCYANFKGATFSCLPYDRTAAKMWLQKARDSGITIAERALRRLDN